MTRRIFFSLLALPFAKRWSLRRKREWVLCHFTGWRPSPNSLSIVSQVVAWRSDKQFFYVNGVIDVMGAEGRNGGFSRLPDAEEYQMNRMIQRLSEYRDCDCRLGHECLYHCLKRVTGVA